MCKYHIYIGWHWEWFVLCRGYQTRGQLSSLIHTSICQWWLCSTPWNCWSIWCGFLGSWSHFRPSQFLRLISLWQERVTLLKTTLVIPLLSQIAPFVGFRTKLKLMCTHFVLLHIWYSLSCLQWYLLYDLFDIIHLQWYLLYDLILIHNSLSMS